MASISFSKGRNWREDVCPPPLTGPLALLGIKDRNGGVPKKRQRSEEGAERKPKVKAAHDSESLAPSVEAEPPSRIPPTYRPEDEPTHIPAEVGTAGSPFVHIPSFEYGVRPFLAFSAC